MEKKDITVKRIYEKNDLNKIKEQNLKDLEKWKPFYPNHERWICGVIQDLNTDSYSRAAFGSYSWDAEAEELTLRCSAIVNKNPFSPYLEIKNTIVLESNNKIADSIQETGRVHLVALIDYIKKFAEQRGYPKLVIELPKKKDKYLISLFLENDFLIVGSQLDKYNNNNEIVFLSCKVNQLYGFDPYDNLRATKWILGKYLNCETPKSSENIIKLYDDKNNLIKNDNLVFYVGDKFESGVEEKFNSKNLAIIFSEDIVKINKDFHQITKIEILQNSFTKIFIFDYTKKNLSQYLPTLEKERFVIFNQQELNTLMGFHSDSSKGYALKKSKARFDYSQIGGLLLISNPSASRFNLKKANDIIKSGKSFIYIKLGNYGTYISDDMPVYFAYYTKNPVKAGLEIWGICNLDSPPEVITPEKVGGYNSSDEAEKLFSYLDSMYRNDDNENIEDRIIWTRDNFNRHNSYNNTKENVIFSVSSFTFLDENNRINIESVIEDEQITKNVRKLFDFYLSKSEVSNIQAELKKEKYKIEQKPISVSNVIDNIEYDIGLSFAGEDRDFVDKVANNLKLNRIKVFYDLFEAERLWGKDLYQNLNDIYKNKCRFTIIFISKAYLEKAWTNHELKSAQARAFNENSEYILPVRFDSTQLPGLNETVSYLDANIFGPEGIAEMALKKLNSI